MKLNTIFQIVKMAKDIDIDIVMAIEMKLR